MNRRLAGAGAVLAGIGVALGAFGSHALSARVPAADVAVWETAVRYHLFHAFAFFPAAWLTGGVGDRLARWGAWAFGLGILLFAGSLYLLVLTGQRWLGAVTPLGGVAFLAGWGLLAGAAWRR